MTLSRPASCNRRRAMLSLVGSACVHAAVYGATLVSLSWFWATEDPSFSGQRTAVYVQAVWAAEQPVEVEPVEIAAELPVEVSPTEAQIEHHKLKVEHAADRPLPEVEVASEVAVATVASSREATKSESAPAEEISPTTEAIHPPRQRTSTPPVSSATVAALPQQIGVDPDEPASFAGNRPPNYPLLAQQRRWEGTVLLRLWIDETGAVTAVEVDRSSGYDVLDAEAVAAVKTWRGSAARRAGRPVPSEETLPVRFRLR